MNTTTRLHSRPRLAALILAGSIAALLCAQSAQAVITYTDGQVDSTNYSNPDTLFIASGSARQTGILSGFGFYFKDGAGTLSLSAANTFTGGMAVFDGTLNIFHDSNLGASANEIHLVGGGPSSPTLQTSSTYSSHTLLALGSGTIDVAQGFTTLQNGALIGFTPPGQALTKTGGGTFFLGAGSGNTFSGDITLAVNGGTFQLGSSVSSSPAGGATLASLTAANTITVNRGATFNIQDNGTNSAAGYIADRLGSAGNRPAVSMNGGTFNLNGANNAAVMTQTLGDLTLASGASTINVTRNTTGTPQLTFSSLSKTSGATVNFTANFASTALGTGTNDARILFTSAPTLVGGGGADGTTTISILPGARSGNDLVTYGANGIRPLVAAEYNAVAGNNINGAGIFDNVKISNATPAAFVPLTGPQTINSLVNSALANGTWAMGNTLTLTSGQFINFPNGGALNITSGVLTAGTFNGSPIDLDITNASNNSMTIGANVNNNGSTQVALVKNGPQTLNLTATGNTYSGGTFVNEGLIFTGTTNNGGYLGTGPVAVRSGGSLFLGAVGAASFSGSVGTPIYTVASGGQITRQTVGVASAANEFFMVASSGVLANTSVLGAGGLDLNTNLNAAPGAILAQLFSGANLAILKGGVPIATAVTTPTYYFGLANTVSENVTVGAGTPWLGLSADLLPRGYGNSAGISTITANSDFALRGAIISSAGAPTLALLNLGLGASATNIIRIATPNGSVNARIEGFVRLFQDNSQFGSAGNTVTFQVTPGAVLDGSFANAQGVVGGAAIAPASIAVQNGGTLTIGNPAAFNGAVSVQPGGMFTQSQGTLTGAGTFTHSNGSILNLTTSTAAVSGATQALGTVPGTIVRLGVNGLLPGTSTAGVTQFDSRLHDAAVYELTASFGNMGAAVAATDSLFTLSASGGIGGVLTNDASSRPLNAATGLIAIGPGGGTFAATTGTTFSVQENFALGTNTLTIGSAQSYDGNPKLGTVQLGFGGVTNTGSAGSVISVLDGATLQLGAANQIPNATSLTVNNGATANIQTFSDTVAGVTLTGGTISGSSGTLTSTTAYDLQAGTVSAILGGTVGLNKTTGGLVTLTGASTYASDTILSDGTLLANNTTGSGTGTGNVTVDGGVFGGTGAITGSVTVNTGGTIAPGASIESLAIGSLSLTSATSHFALEIDLGLPAADLLSVTGGISLSNSTLDLSLANVSPTGLPATFLFASNDLSDAIAGTFGTITGVPLGYTATLNYAYAGTDALGRVGTGNDLAITFSLSAVPEPGTALFGLACLGLAGIRRRKR